MFGAIPSWAFYVRHAKNIKLQGINLTLEHPDKRSPFIFEDVTQLKLVGIEAPIGEGASPVLHFKDVTQIMISGCLIPKNQATFIDIPANQKHEIQLIGNGVFRN